MQPREVMLVTIFQQGDEVAKFATDNNISTTDITVKLRNWVSVVYQIDEPSISFRVMQDRVSQYFTRISFTFRNPSTDETIVSIAGLEGLFYY